MMVGTTPLKRPPIPSVFSVCCSSAAADALLPLLLQQRACNCVRASSMGAVQMTAAVRAATPATAAEPSGSLRSYKVKNIIFAGTSTPTAGPNPLQKTSGPLAL